MASPEYNLPYVLNLHTFAESVERMMAMRDVDRAREPPTTVTVTPSPRSALLRAGLCSRRVLFA